MNKLKYFRLDITDYKDYLKIVSEYKNLSITKYIQNLIRKDMDENKEHYEIIRNMQNTAYSIADKIKWKDVAILGKVGRPKLKHEDEKIINIAVPYSIYNLMNIAKLKYDNNLTKYVNKIIKKDLDVHMEEYRLIKKLLRD